MKKKIIGFLVIFVIFTAFAGIIPAQNDTNAGKKRSKASQKKLDEIIEKWNKAGRKGDAVNVLKYASQALEIFQAENNPKMESEALVNIGRAHQVLKNYKKALECAKKALALAKETNYQFVIAASRDLLGGTYFQLSDYDRALEHYLESLKIKQKMGDPRYIATTLANVGNCYSSLGQYDKALEYHVKSTVIFEKLGYKNGIAHGYANIAQIYHDLKNFDKALEYYRESLKVGEKIKNKTIIAHSLSGIGMIYGYAKDYRQALEYLLRAQKIGEEIQDKNIMADTTSKIGALYLFLNKFDKSLEFQDKALKIANDTGHQWSVVTSLLSMGNVYNTRQNYDEAMECFKKGLEIAKKINAKVLINECYKAVSAVHEAQKNYQQSLQYYKLFHQTDKNLVDEKSRKQFDQLQVQYETEKKEQEIVMLKKNKEIQELQLSRERITRNAFIIGFLLVLIILALLFKKYLYLFTFWKKQQYIGQFRLIEKIGAGGMGAIYKAHRIVNKSEIVAIKILKEELFVDITTKKRFQREAAIIDQLTHPNIVSIYERGESKHKIFIAMEFLEGKTLESKIAEQGGLTLPECLHIMKQIAEVFVFIHSKNIIHRDLKPANIMLIKKNGAPNFVKLLDFGLAKMEVHTRLTQSGNFIGTIEYASPEQLSGAEISPANDIFSMGVTFYKMLCGRVPFQGETATDIMREIIGKNPPPVSQYRPDIPAELNHLIMQMIQKTPQLRPSAELIRNQLQNVWIPPGLSPLS